MINPSFLGFAPGLPSTGITLIQEISIPVGSSISTFNFNNIPQTYRDLVLISHARMSSGGTISREVDIQFNGDTGANYDWWHIWNGGGGGGATAGTGSTAGYLFVAGGDTAPTGHTGQSTAFIPAYAHTDYHKYMKEQGTFQQGSGAGNFYMVDHFVAWHNTAAIFSITIKASSGNFAAGSSFRLYGLK